VLSDGFWRIIRIGVVGLILAAAVAGLALGDAWLWVAVEWSPPAYAGFYERGGFDTLTTGALLLAALVKAACLWLILRAPAPGPLDRREKALRRLLCLAVAYALVLWYPIALLPDVVGGAFQLALWTAIYVLYVLVIRWRSRMLRAAAGVMFAVELAGTVNELLDELDLPELGSGDIVLLVLLLNALAAIIITVVGQRRDGRWSRGTQAAGWLSVGVYALVIAFNYLSVSIFDGNLAMLVMLDAVGLVSTVWLAATARELPTEDRPADLPPARRRVIRVAMAAVVVLPIIAMIPPERAAHLTYTGWSMDCYDRPSFGDLKPAERDAAFLCRARSAEAGVAPMFPDSLADQEVLAYGRCAGPRTATSRRRSWRGPGARGPPGARTRGISSTSARRSSARPIPSCCGRPRSRRRRTPPTSPSRTRGAATRGPGRRVSSRPRPTTSCSSTAITAIWSTTLGTKQPSRRRSGRLTSSTTTAPSSGWPAARCSSGTSKTSPMCALR
jgi:hypothetical protein